MKGLFIPEITAEMFKNGCLESIEALMAEGEIYDIEYSPWIPVSEELPDKEEYWIALEEWKKDFKGFINELSMPKDDYNGIMEYIDELPVTPQPQNRILDITAIK